MSIDWNTLKQEAANQDLHVQTSEPLFDGQAKGATIQAPQVVEMNSNFQKGLAVKLSYKIEDELVDIDGNTKAPGQVVSEFPYLVIGRGDDEEEKKKNLEKARQGIRALAFKLEHAKLVKRGEIDALPQAKRVERILELVPQLEGRPIMVSLSTTRRSKPDESGEFPLDQRVKTSAVREG